MNMVTGCSGIDAIAYAAELLDIDIIGQIEIDPFCNQILELRYPGVKRLNDVFDVKGDEFGTVDIFSFGDPCQPHSVAGRQKGIADERYIWPELYRIIKTMRPTWIINENVTGSVSNGVVLSKINDLENEGYRARAFIIPACSVGAPHQRYRVFIVGYAERGRLSGQSWGRTGQEFADGYVESEKDVADTNEQHGNDAGLHTGEVCRERSEPSRVQGCAMADTAGTRLPFREQSRGREDAEKTRSGMEFKSERCGKSLVNASRSGCEKCDPSRITTNQRHVAGRHIEARADRTIKSGVGGNASGIPERLHGSERYEDGQGVFETFEAIFTATLEQIKWPAGYGAEQHSYEPPRVIKGMKNRTNRLKALGNAIVPWQVFPFLLAISLIGGMNIDRCNVFET